MTTPTEHDLIDIASRMAQELQDFIADAEKAGCENPLPGTRALIEEWEEIFSRTDLAWKKAIIENDDIPSGSINL